MPKVQLTAAAVERFKAPHRAARRPHRQSRLRRNPGRGYRLQPTRLSRWTQGGAWGLGALRRGPCPAGGIDVIPLAGAADPAHPLPWWSMHRQRPTAAVS